MMGKPIQKSAAVLPDGMTVKAPTRDLAGHKFGRLTAVRVVGKHTNKSLIWECVCDCGAVINRTSASLRKADGISSCGCLNSEQKVAYFQNFTPWNLGKTYANKPAGAVYKNKKAWADAVRRENGEACQRCGWDKARCDVHHIVPKSMGGLNIVSNGVVICPNCHRVEHTSHVVSAANDNQKSKEKVA